MNFILQNDDPRNDVFFLGPGQPVYELCTQASSSHRSPTTIRRVDCGGAEVAQIQRLEFDRSQVCVRGRTLKSKFSGILSLSQTFVASDGESYKWKPGDSNTLKLTREHVLIALYTRANAKKPGVKRATLEIMQDGVHLIDEIVATFVHLECKIRGIRKPSAARVALIISDMD